MNRLCGITLLAPGTIIRKLSEWQRLVSVFQSLPVYSERRVAILNLADSF